MCNLVFPSVELNGERAADEAVQPLRAPRLAPRAGAGPDAELTLRRQAPREPLPVVSGREAAASHPRLRGCSGWQCPRPLASPFVKLDVHRRPGSIRKKSNQNSSFLCVGTFKKRQL
ncbi:hypothetical protein R6Z07F_010988 [Ovis aries]